MKTLFSFTEQYFDAAPLARESRVVLAGGLYPLRGSRSAYQASVVCFDVSGGAVVWRFEKTKCYPYRAIATARDVCAVTLDQNFVGCPVGLYRFDLATGKPMPLDCDVRGSTISPVDVAANAATEAFLFSWVAGETSYLRAVHARDGLFQERSFPYRSKSEGKSIERVIAVDDESFVAIFSLVVGRQVVHSVERWTFTSASSMWEKRTPLRRVVRNGNVLLFWNRSEPHLDVGLLSLTSGAIDGSFRIPLANVEAIQPIDARTYAVLAFSGVYVLDATSQTVSIVAKMKDGEFLDFGAIAFDAIGNKLIVVTAGNHTRPGTTVMAVDL